MTDPRAAKGVINHSGWLYITEFRVGPFEVVRVYRERAGLFGVHGWIHPCPKKHRCCR